MQPMRSPPVFPNPFKCSGVISGLPLTLPCDLLNIEQCSKERKWPWPNTNCWKMKLGYFYRWWTEQSFYVQHSQIDPKSKALKTTHDKQWLKFYNDPDMVCFLEMLKGKQEFDSLSWCTKRSKRKCAEIFCQTECISGKRSALHTFDGFHIFQLKNKWIWLYFWFCTAKVQI